MGNKEIWKSVKGYEGLYEVSNLGRVRSIDRIVRCNSGINIIKGCILKQYLEKKGYLRVHLCNKQIGKHFLVHRLVAEAFIPNPDNKPTVNHINHDRTDNRVENLEWATFSEQMDKITLDKLSKKILQYDKQGNLIKKWDSIRMVEREIGLKHQDIIAVLKHKYREGHNYNETCGGFVWKYA